MNKFNFKIVSIAIIFIIYFCFNNVYGISSEFKFVIDTIGIPEYNVYGEQINEDIYYTYNVFVYSSPAKLMGVYPKQRFKPVPNLGRWTLEDKKYVSDGTQGEYNILGTSYSGSLVYNVFFPVDAVPEIIPEYWEFTTIPGAYESWFDDTKYKYNEQIEFMKTKKLLFDELNFVNNTANPYNLIEYNISASTIGLDKVMLNTCSTWKTMGIVTVKRKNNKGQLRDATLATPPMAASADVISLLNANDEYTIPSDKESIQLNLNFGVQAINLNNYANAKHIKEITSIIYINGNEFCRIERQ